MIQQIGLIFLLEIITEIAEVESKLQNLQTENTRFFFYVKTSRQNPA